MGDTTRSGRALTYASPVRTSNAADRVVTLLQYLAERPTEGFTISELSRRLEISKATCHALAGSLIEAGWLTRDPSNMHVTLGPAVFAAGARFMKSPGEFTEYARPEMEFLSAKYAAQGVATIPVGDEIVVTDTFGSPGAPGIANHVGQRIPLRPPLGFIYVAWSDEEERAIWQGYESDAVAEVLRVVRERGFSVALNLDVPPAIEKIIREVQATRSPTEIEAVVSSVLDALRLHEYTALAIARDQEYRVRNVSVPVFDSAKRLSLVLSLVGFSRPLSGSTILTVANALKDVAARVSDLASATVRAPIV